MIVKWESISNSENNLKFNVNTLILFYLYIWIKSSFLQNKFKWKKYQRKTISNFVKFILNTVHNVMIFNINISELSQELDAWNF